MLFGFPLALTIGTLTARTPSAGGLYVWARDDFGPWHGFLSFWLYWMGIVCWFPGAAMFYMSSGLYIFGPSFAQNRTLVIVISVAAVWIALGTNIVGLQVGKWTQNTGAIACWLLLLVLGSVATWYAVQHGSVTPLHDVIPPLRWDSLPFWAAIAYATSGMEIVGLMGGEIRDPERTVPRAAAVAAVFCTVFYILATLSVLVVLRPESVGELRGLAEAGRAAGQAAGAPWIAPAIAALILLSAVGQFGGLGTAVSRLPFAAGLDNLLPAGFARVHPRWATPHIAILTLGMLSTVLLLAMQFGDSMQAAYDAIVSLTVLAGFVPYLYIFASGWKAGRRLSAVSGWFVTIIALVCTVIPPPEIRNVFVFEAKILLGTVALIASAAAVYRCGVRRTSSRKLGAYG